MKNYVVILAKYFTAYFLKISNFKNIDALYEWAWWVSLRERLGIMVTIILDGKSRCSIPTCKWEIGDKDEVICNVSFLSLTGNILYQQHSCSTTGFASQRELKSLVHSLGPLQLFLEYKTFQLYLEYKTKYFKPSFNSFLYLVWS